MSYPAGGDLNSFMQTSRVQRAHSLMSNSSRIDPGYHPSELPANYETHSEINFNRAPPLRALSPDDIQKMRYKIDLDKQVAEKQQRRSREWERKLERDRKYVRHQPFGTNGHTTVLNKQQLEEILSKGRAPSPVLDMPQEYPLHHQQLYSSSEGNMYGSPQQSTYNNSPQYTNYSNMQTKPPSPQKNDYSLNNTTDFQRFYGPNRNASGTSSNFTSSSTSQPIRGDAHDPFILYDPNKEGQNVFNVIPQQDLYDPWGRPGGGAPLIHQSTGQKYTRYSGSLQDKLNTVGPLGFHRRQYSGNIDEQKRDLESEQRRRQQEELEHRSNAGDTAEWITHLENSRYPLKLHLPTTETTREYIGARNPYRYSESRSLHEDLVRQADERSQVNKMNRFQNNIAELQHTEAQNSWWGKGGGGAPIYSNRRHNVQNTFERPRQKWTTNHLGQLTMADDEPQSQVKVYSNDYLYPKTTRSSNHRNFYESPDDQTV